MIIRVNHCYTTGITFWIWRHLTTLLLFDDHRYLIKSNQWVLFYFTYVWSERDKVWKLQCSRQKWALPVLWSLRSHSSPYTWLLFVKICTPIPISHNKRWTSGWYMLVCSRQEKAARAEASGSAGPHRPPDWTFILQSTNSRRDMALCLDAKTKIINQATGLSCQDTLQSFNVLRKWWFCVFAVKM